MKPSGFLLRLFLSLLAALPPLSIDLCLPALPLMGLHLGFGEGSFGLVLSVFLIGFAIAQIIFGPASDYLGRRPVLIVACAVFAIAGFGCALSSSTEMLLFFRFIEGLGAGTATVLAFAIVRDVFAGDVARTRIAEISAILSIAPIVAPSIGVALTAIGGWQSIFFALAASGLVLLVVSVTKLPETRRELPRVQVWKAYFAIVTTRGVLPPLAAVAFSYGSLFSYVGTSPQFFMSYYGLSQTIYGLMFASTAAGLVIGATASSVLAKRSHDTCRVIRHGLQLGLLTAGAIASFTLFWPRGPLFIIIPLITGNLVSLGLIAPNAAHLVISLRSDLSAAASALVGFAQMLIGAAASAISSRLFAVIGAPGMGAAMFAFASAAFLSGCFSSPTQPVAKEPRHA